MESLWIIDKNKFQLPCACLIAGPSQSGKTTLMYEILLNNKQLMNPVPDRIVYCYSAWQKTFEKFHEIIPKIEFHQGVIDTDDFDSSINNLIIFDDLMKDCTKNKDIFDLFTVNSHHKNISVFLLVQNLFSQDKYSRTISLNSQYLIIFNNPRDKQQINFLGRQLFPNKSNFFLEAFSDACEKFRYIFLDLKQATLEKNRVQTGILPKNKTIIYTPKC